MRALCLAFALSACVVAPVARADAPPPSVVDEQESTSSVRLARISLEAGGAVLGSLVGYGASYLVLSQMGAFHDVLPGWNPWVTAGGLAAGSAAGAAIGTILAGWIYEGRPSVVGSALSALFGGALLWVGLGLVRSSTLSLPDGPLASVLTVGLLFIPAIQAVFGQEVELHLRARQRGVHIAVAPQLGVSARGAAIVGTF